MLIFLNFACCLLTLRNLQMPIFPYPPHRGLKNYYHWICLFWLWSFSWIFRSCITAASSVAVAIYTSKHVFPVKQIVNVIVARLGKYFGGQLALLSSQTSTVSGHHKHRPDTMNVFPLMTLCVHSTLVDVTQSNSKRFLTNIHLPTLWLWIYNGGMMICLTGREI